MSTAGTCRACRAPLDHEARFCRACGAMQGALPQEQGVQGSSWPPGHHPPSQQPVGPPRRQPLLAVAIGLGMLLVAGVVVALVLASGGSQVVTAPPATVTAAAAQPASGAVNGRTAPAVGQPPATTATQPIVSAGGQTSYRAAQMSARVPSGWSIEENEVRKSGYVESRWQIPAVPGAYALIDESPATHLTPEQDAAPVHATLEQAAGYQEISYVPGDLAGVSSWMWIFRISGDQRIDYFFERCADTFGVLGSAPAAHFASLQPVFRLLAESVHSPCG